MGWKEDVHACVAAMPVEFGLHDLDRFIPRLHARHPANGHIEAKIRQQLQLMRDEGKLQFLGNGRYRQQTGGGLTLAPGTETSRQELATLLEMEGPAALQRGMFKRSAGKFSSDLLLFHQAASNMYGDTLDADGRIVYIGEGQTGDQTLSGNNRHLANHLEEGTRVHFFVKETQAGDRLVYEGPVVLDKVCRDYRPDEGRTVLEFHLIPDEGGASEHEFGRAYQEILESSLEPVLIDRQQSYNVVKRGIRDRAFASHLRRVYNEKCAVCGTPLAHPDEKYLDLQGAHVRSVAAGGPDQVNNGICLCARHHWAFDHGVFGLTDDYRIELPAATTDPHGELISGAEVSVPDGPKAPHKSYLDWHRRAWNLV